METFALLCVQDSFCFFCLSVFNLHIYSVCRICLYPPLQQHCFKTLHNLSVFAKLFQFPITRIFRHFPTCGCSSIEDVDAKSGPEGRVSSKVKIKKKTKKKSRQTQTKQRGSKVPSKQDTIEYCNMTEFYGDGACEDGPTSYFELTNTPALNRSKRRRLSTPRNHVTWHVFRSSPFFAHAKQTPKSNDVKKIEKTLSNTALIIKPENTTTAVKVHTRRRKKPSPVSSNGVLGTTEIVDEIKESSGHVNESSEWKDAGDQSSYLSKEAVNSGVLSSKATSKAKTSVYFTTTVKALGQRDIVNKTWIPPISVHALIQEDLYQDPWKVLVACMLLNRTSGTQVRKVIWDLFALCPTPEAAVAVETDKIEEVIRHLGLQKKRACMIQKFSKDYLGKEWLNVGELHGIGKYATDAYAIFCEGRWREVKPKDHKLVDYWRYLCATDGLGYAFKDNREKGHEVVTSMSQAES